MPSHEDVAVVVTAEQSGLVMDTAIATWRQAAVDERSNDTLLGNRNSQAVTQLSSNSLIPQPLAVAVDELLSKLWRASDSDDDNDRLDEAIDLLMSDPPTFDDLVNLN